MKPEEVEAYKEKNWILLLRNCRRLVPNRERLLKRFNSVIDQFWNVIDAKSGKKVLVRPTATEAVKLLRKHIKADCLSDPDGVALYYATGKTTAGITKRRCVRGANSTEVSLMPRTLQELTSTVYPIDIIPLLVARCMP